MIEFNPNCGKCGMLNSRGFCSLTACRYPSNAIVVEHKVIRGMMVNPQIEKPQTNADRIRAMTDEDLAEWCIKIQDDVADYYDGGHAFAPELPTMENSWLDWLKQEASE